MEFPFNVIPLLPDRVCVWTGDMLRRPAVRGRPFASGRRHANSDHACPRSTNDEKIRIIDAMGEASAKVPQLPLPSARAALSAAQAQKLGQVITTATRLQASDHRLYIMRDPAAPAFAAPHHINSIMRHISR